MGWNVANVGAVAGPLSDAYDVPLAVVGLLTTALFVTHFASQVPGGRLVDRIGARRAGLGAVAVIAGGNVLALAAASLPLALAARLVVGLGTGTGFVAGSDYVRSATASPTAQGLYGGAAVGGGGVALAIVPLLSGWRAPYASAAVVAAVLGALLAASPADERHRRTRGSPGAETSVIGDARLYPLAVLHTASFSVSVIAGNWIVDLLDDHGHSRRLAGAVGALILLLGLPTRPFAGWLLRTHAALARTVVAASLLAGAAGLVVLATPAPLPLLIAGSAVAGLAAGIPFAVAFSGAQRLRPDAPAAAVGFVNSVATLVIVAGTPLIGLTFSLPGDGRIGFAVLACACLAALPAAQAPSTRPPAAAPPR